MSGNIPSDGKSLGVTAVSSTETYRSGAGLLPMVCITYVPAAPGARTSRSMRLPGAIG